MKELIKKEYFAQVNEWWGNLKPREQIIVKYGALFVAVLFLYFLFWSPYTNYLANLRVRLHHAEENYAWLQTTDANIARLQKLAHGGTQKVSLIQLLGLLHQKINAQGLQKNLVELKQLNDSAIQLQFKNISYQVLMQFLLDLSHATSVEYKNVVLNPVNHQGLINASMEIS